MKWNWFCPLPPAKTGIADYAADILPSLAAHAEITLWTDQPDWDPSLANYGPIRPYNPAQISWSDFNQADLNIYHIGNHPIFHGAIWQLARSCPGLIVLHDQSLHHLFGAFYRDWSKARSAYFQLMRRYYGEESLPAADAFFDERLATEFMAEHFPLTRHALEQSLGVVVHSSAAFEDLKIGERLPVAYFPLPYVPKKCVESITDRPLDGPLRLIVFGFLGRNRRLEIILRALANLPHRERIHLEICGEIHEAKEITALAELLGIREAVTVRGFLSEHELDIALERAHMAINLRFPSMGEASFSQLRIWDHALPSMVTRVGWYATLPEEIVCFVRPENELGDISANLRAILDDPLSFAEMGRRGRKFLEREHSSLAYASDFAEFANAVPAGAAATIERLTDRVGDIARDWLPQDADLASVANVAREIVALTGGE